MDKVAFFVWLAGFFANAGIYMVWRDSWKSPKENKILYILRVIFVLSTSWFGFGVVIGRIAKKIIDSDVKIDK